MTGIYFDGAVRLISYSAVTKGAKATIKIELEASDRYDLASLLRQLDEIDREQREAAKPAPKATRPAARKSQLALPAPMLQLEDQRESDT
ncbi:MULTISPECIES: hypothetical protein [unclassified Shinella]|uniref:hypothetical protein n=1 Tax=unclassified Shinella TaxID=2643062 RepID=UPI00225D6ABE|nr:MULTISPECIES: hypothetical protein [unclassified Shinella]MCO5139015.1 hypothetical protein [Shinella sp.]MDC7256256.1 hypothetical protein [Shinella sp. YE25]CAI0339113.1 conserved hypothetical protein [Rhizobiaceae bacterium]CAK7257528.1 conserved protein of unknown function [Shinella sp. WSC3-e]